MHSLSPHQRAMEAWSRRLRSWCAISFLTPDMNRSSPGYVAHENMKSCQMRMPFSSHSS